jgi:hypothetical protein
MTGTYRFIEKHNGSIVPWKKLHCCDCSKLPDKIECILAACATCSQLDCGVDKYMLTVLKVAMSVSDHVLQCKILYCHFILQWPHGDG